MRHFFHGDIVPPDAEQPHAQRALAAHPGVTVAYCGRCDMFEPASVVLAHVPEIRVRRIPRTNRLVQEPRGGPERLAVDVERYRRARPDWRARWVRPADAPNIFAAPPPPEAHHARS